MTITAFDHYTVRCRDLRASWLFYEQALGLRAEERLGASAPGARVYIGELEVVNLFQASPEQEAIFRRLVPPDDEAAQWPTGRLQHVGFWAKGVEALRTRLTANAVAFRERTLADKHQFFLHDPDGVEIEVNFPLSEVG
ncbi:MAG: VOC family protein [Chloroflexota bacterium]